MIKIYAISDMHGLLDFNIEPASVIFNEKGDISEINPVDILFICGDIVPLYIQRNVEDSFIWIKEVFIPWCKELPVDQIYMVAGNHDFALQNEQYTKSLFVGTNITILYNEGAEYRDINGKIWTIWGSPNCHIFGNWAFMYSDEYNKEKYELMPENLDFLITHDAPYGRSDILLQVDCPWANGEHIGNKPLAEVVEARKPKHHFFGHLHSCNHELTDYEGTKTACVSLVNENYKLVYKPLYLEVQ